MGREGSWVATGLGCVGALSVSLAGASETHRASSRPPLVPAAHGSPIRSPAPRIAVPTPSHVGAPGGDHRHWSYEGEEGPAHWGEMSPEFAICTAGRMQSPIDLGQANTKAGVEVAADYRRGPLTILNNGHTVQVQFDAGSTFTSSGKDFQLVQLHFHTPSEHQLNGKSFPAEVHFVHRNAAGQLAVLGVFIEAGPTNVELAKLIVAAPRMKSEPHLVEGFTFDPRALLPPTLAVYRYMGSLTTPGCGEGVNWHVAADPIQASPSQIAELARIMGNNARPVQPVNNRLVISPSY